MWEYPRVFFGIFFFFLFFGGEGSGLARKGFNLYRLYHEPFMAEFYDTTQHPQPLLSALEGGVLTAFAVSSSSTSGGRIVMWTILGLSELKLYSERKYTVSIKDYMKNWLLRAMRTVNGRTTERQLVVKLLSKEYQPNAGGTSRRSVPLSPPLAQD